MMVAVDGLPLGGLEDICLEDDIDLEDFDAWFEYGEARI
jgi:hypothetical protein